jgi:hypothetical protein
MRPPLVMEEKKRPGEYYPVEESDRYTTIMSSKDLNMIHHLGALKGRRGGLHQTRRPDEKRLLRVHGHPLLPGCPGRPRGFSPRRLTGPSPESWNMSATGSFPRDSTLGQPGHLPLPNTEEYNISHVFMATIPSHWTSPVETQDSLRSPRGCTPRFYADPWM